LDDGDDKLYDEVDEEEYSKIVSSRASNWIVDDGEFWKILYSFQQSITNR
jgi:hypothetical protein